MIHQDISRLFFLNTVNKISIDEIDKKVPFPQIKVS